MTTQAREALEAQVFRAPGPKLIQEVADAIERSATPQTAGELIHKSTSPNYWPIHLN